MTTERDIAADEISHAPPYTVSGKAMNLIAEIAAAMERYRIILEGADGVRLRKLKDANRLRRIGPYKGGHWEVV